MRTFNISNVLSQHREVPHVEWVRILYLIDAVRFQLLSGPIRVDKRST